MNLWIRSQDKEILKKFKMLEISESNRGSYYIISGEYVIGEYKTRERALEILDDIQHEILNKQELQRLEFLRQEETIVVEMPEE